MLSSTSAFHLLRCSFFFQHFLKSSFLSVILSSSPHNSVLKHTVSWTTTEVMYRFVWLGTAALIHSPGLSNSVLSPVRLVCYVSPSEMDLKTSPGFFSTISAPLCPPHPPALSVAFPPLRPPTRPAASKPSLYDYSLPAFAPAHPPALPRIFQPGATSGISQERTSAVALR